MLSVRSKFPRVLSLLCLAVCAGADLSSQEIDRNSSGDRAPGPSEPASIVIEELVQFHAPGIDLAKVCRSGSQVYGCTDFPVESLECDCIPVNGGWKIVARARLQAVIHLRNPKTLVHERQHLSDLRRALAEHIESAGLLVYPDERICRVKARVMSAPSYVRDVMNAIRIASNRKYGCQQRAHAASAL